MRQIPVDLHREPKKFRMALLSLALIAVPAASFVLGFSAEAPAVGLQTYRPSLVPVPLTLPNLQPPVVEVQPEPEPPAPSQPAPAPTPSKAELALKQIQVSLAAEKERREEDEREKREEEERRKAEEERKQKEEEKKKREEEERKEREEEEQRKAEEERQKEEARKQREEEAEAALRAAEERAAELRAQADAEAWAAEEKRLAGLRDIYIGRLENRIGNETDTPAELEGRDDVVVRVEIFLHPDGELKGWPKVIRSSGYPDYDNEAVRAIIKVAPLVIPNADEEPELAREFLYLKLDISPGKERQFWQ